MENLYFFGCRNGRLGHFMLGEHYTVTTEGMPWTWDPPVYELNLIDGGFLHRKYGPEGEAKLTHTENWTVISWIDSSVDTRGGSNANLLAPGKYTFEEMMAAGRQKFPEIMDRFDYEITLFE